MSYLNQVKFDNAILIKQLSDFVLALSPEHYQQANQSLSSGAIGAHVRHIIEHYQSLLSVLNSAMPSPKTDPLQVDYDARARNVIFEQCAHAASTEMLSLLKVINGLTSDQLVSVYCSTNINEASEAAGSSTIRELVFLHSHTTHHMAIIRLLALSIGVSVNDGFGKATSTKRFEKSVQSQLA